MYRLEVTDTYAGEANYSWVRRATLPSDPAPSRRAIIKAVRELSGWPTSIRLETTDYGDALTIRPRGVCQVAFVNFDWSE